MRCSCCQLEIFVCVRGNDVVFMFLLSCTSCPYARCLSVGSVYSALVGELGKMGWPGIWRHRNQHKAQEPTQCVAGDIRLLANLRADQLSDP